jgi:uncharacterized membrane protein
MARRFTVKSYPLLKFTLPLAVIIAAVGIVLFMTHSTQCTADLKNRGQPCTLGETFHDHPTGKLLPYVLGAVVVALLGVTVRRRETVNVLLPSDTLEAASRAEQQKLLDGLEEARRKGELTEERYRNARDRVLSKMGKQGGKPGKP